LLIPQADRFPDSPDVDRESGANAPRKRRKLHENTLEEKEQRWINFLKDVEEFDIQHVQGKGKFTFAFVEGPLIKALRNGDWWVAF
jgi:midasin